MWGFGVGFALGSTVGHGLVPLLGVTAVAAAVARGLVAIGPPTEDLPVADFNHAIHIARDLECLDCHTGVETRAAAGVPSITICAECHDDPEDSMAKSANGKRILDHIKRGEEQRLDTL